MSYERKHLRAPFREPILFEDEGHVYKALGANISEGGIQIHQMPHFPKSEIVSVMFPLPQFPRFMNYSLERLKSFSQEIFPDKVVNGKIKSVRRMGETSSVDEVFRVRIGVQFIELDPFAQKLIADYVDTFASNVIHLLRLIEDANAFKLSLESARVLAKILRYPDKLKLAELHRRVAHDYVSLQWLKKNVSTH